jgi:hypothetical protein
MQHEADEAGALARIQRLVDEEHRLFRLPAPAEQETRRLKEVQVELDQCWRLLREQRAAREYGRDLPRQ